MLIGIFLTVCFSLNLAAQTAGTLTFTYTQVVPIGTTASKNVIAVWIESGTGTFIKTKMRFVGGGTSDHVPTWTSKSGQTYNQALIDATTGATRTSTTNPTAFGVKTFTWDGKSSNGVINGNVVTDGIYKIWIESSWQNSLASNAHNAITSFTFTKGTATAHLTPTGDANFNTIIIDWVPAVVTTIPTVSTVAATSITTTNAICGGNVSADGGSAVIERGICYGPTLNPVATGTHYFGGSGIGSFSCNLFLNPGTYHFRAYAINSIGTAYGDDMTFATVPLQLPIVQTAAVTSITSTTAMCGGYIVPDTSYVFSRGIDWGLDSIPHFLTMTMDGTGNGSFTSQMTGLTPGTTYYVRAYASNSDGTAFGQNVIFTTLQNTGYTFYGNVMYNNSANTFVEGATVNLMSGTTQIATTTTNVDGYFTFLNVANGTYTLEFSTSKIWGGVTSTDVLKMRRHIAGLETLTEPIRLSAADPNNTGSVTSTDVLKVQRRIAGMDASFTRPDWIFAVPTTGGNSVTVNGTNVTQSFYAICVGDVNGSNIPVISK